MVFIIPMKTQLMWEFITSKVPLPVSIRWVNLLEGEMVKAHIYLNLPFTSLSTATVTVFHFVFIRSESPKYSIM